MFRTEDAFEVRRYEPYLVAETLVAGSADEAGSQGFRMLAGYIFGKNKGAREIAMTAPVVQTPTKIAMTAPVAQSPGAGGYVVQFAMPAEWTLETLPEPTDPAVRLRAVPARRVAVIRYSGTWSQERYAEHLAKLQDALPGPGWAGAASRSGRATTRPGSPGSCGATRSGSSSTDGAEPAHVPPGRLRVWAAGPDFSPTTRPVPVIGWPRVR